MKDLFKEVMGMDGVKGVLLLSFDGEIIFKQFSSSPGSEPEKRDWGNFVASLEGMRETDLVFDNGRIYIRRSDLGYLLVVMESVVSVAMLRLNCDIILPSLTPVKGSKGIKRLFKK